MTDLQKEFEETGYASWINLYLYPDGKIYTQEYTQWLEKQVQALRIAHVVGRSEQLTCPRCKSTNILKPDKDNDAQCIECAFIWTG